jgi:hypothetical protein
MKDTQQAEYDSAGRFDRGEADRLRKNLFSYASCVCSQHS